MLTKIVSVPEHVKTSSDSNVVNLKTSQDNRMEKDKASAMAPNELAVAVTVVNKITFFLLNLK